ncbi:Cytochrome [Cardamine amara subsp. amara]|uniref:Cytochrome n=1 Tax=Cardamine amara subsp. amara TaxID=228776 RepID=A0ABD0ZM16_CARAN
MGRMESIWGKDCDQFYPERWIDETSGGFRGEIPYKFPVFHAGPRMCIGEEMAYIQMKSIAAAVLERFVVEVPRKERPEILLSVTLRMRRGLFARIHERS